MEGATDFRLSSQFRRCGFGDTETPADADSWLKELKKIFRLARCTYQRKVGYAIFLLKKDAQDWWVTQEQFYESLEVITWDHFKGDFTEHFIPDSYQSKRIVDFFALRQGGCTVEELDRQFRALSRYVPGMASNDLVMWERFFDILEENVKWSMAGTKWKSYAELVQAAIRSERALPRQLRGQQGQQKRYRDQQQSTGDRLQKRYEGSSKGQGHGSTAEQPRQCFTCGRMGHIARDCRQGGTGRG